MAIRYPLVTEKCVDMIEKENKLIFVVDKNDTKSEVKDAVEKLYNVKVESIKTAIDMKGRKRAFVKLSKGSSASELATKLNLL